MAIHLAADLVLLDLIPLVSSVFTSFSGYLRFFPFDCTGNGASKHVCFAWGHELYATRPSGMRTDIGTQLIEMEHKRPCLG
jgi:hypothetical protein